MFVVAKLAYVFVITSNLAKKGGVMHCYAHYAHGTRDTHHHNLCMFCFNKFILLLNSVSTCSLRIRSVHHMVS